VFTLTTSDATSARRIRNDTDLLQPEFLDLKHAVEGKAGSVGHRDRHLISVRRVKKDTTTGELHEAVVNITIAMPRSGVITRAEMDEMTNVARNFIVTNNLTQLYRGEL